MSIVLIVAGTRFQGICLLGQEVGGGRCHTEVTEVALEPGHADHGPGG